MKRVLKTIGKILLGITAVSLIVCVYFYARFKPVERPVWGVSFSVPHAQYLGLDYKQVYSELLNDLGVKNLRLMAYWENIEPKQGKFDFSEIDYLVEEAGRSGAEVILVVGHKQPRWPECHHPDWYENLNENQKQEAVLNMLGNAVNHFKNYSNIKYWQVENEPFFDYGRNCPTISKEFLAKEVALVKSLDPRPVVITDSGEKGWWPRAAQSADILGSTMYRTVNNPRWGGYITYPIPAAWYRIQAGMAQSFSGIRSVIGSELQTEPWFEQDVRDTPVARQIELMGSQKLRDNINYASKTGFSEHYLWGAEWWYYMKEQGHPEILETMRSLFK
ncbi:MAG: hypothetical protein COT92_00255 [Candidatus Doudnabacteria bacterium CG10_big_fil_rev_8_21_14_0_10_42_18]|uniref:GH10 domain-containing protein n=1 Tax=Candidatus Doudnabacteria bacterium CG10_big_fil_rev_8_21_14_0_10_42_18 TaxID=1974552 RepID=A0A2H0VC10_9BACT|nr:MAG: hypothetical protein COT92_00255 [Candidatus Doudnabacteria bacterium CG10_big_fil_rev_8_21_14_0_10_42_18]